MALILPVLASAEAAGAGAPRPGSKDKCPVCGMFVAKYPDWTAVATLADGSRRFFDGPKDLFKFVLDPGRYEPGKTRTDLNAVQVTDYYTVAPVDGAAAYYVIGSDVYGPMGRELVPFARERDAREFLRDHAGEGVLRYREITPAVVQSLDR